MFIKRFIALSILLALPQTLLVSKPLNEDRIEFMTASSPWKLTLPKDGLVIRQKQVKPDGKSAYFLMTDEKNKLSISFFIEPVKDCQDSKACRDLVWKLGNPSWESPQNVVQSEVNGLSCFEFFMPSFQGVPVKQQHMYAEFVKDGFWVDLHISKVLYRPQEHELFERVIKSIKFEARDSGIGGLDHPSDLR